MQILPFPSARPSSSSSIPTNRQRWSAAAMRWTQSTCTIADPQMSKTWLMHSHLAGGVDAGFGRRCLSPPIFTMCFTIDGKGLFLWEQMMNSVHHHPPRAPPRLTHKTRWGWLAWKGWVRERMRKKWARRHMLLRQTPRFCARLRAHCHACVQPWCNNKPPLRSLHPPY